MHTAQRTKICPAGRVRKETERKTTDQQIGTLQKNGSAALSAVTLGSGFELGSEACVRVRECVISDVKKECRWQSTIGENEVKIHTGVMTIVMRRIC